MEAEALLEGGQMVVHSKPKRFYVSSSKSAKTISPRKTRASERALGTLQGRASKKRIIFTQKNDDFLREEQLDELDQELYGNDALDDPALLGSTPEISLHNYNAADEDYFPDSAKQFDFDYFFNHSNVTASSEACTESDSSLSDEELSLLLQC